MPQAYICYAREDQAFVRRLTDALSEHNREAWVDWKDIPLSADWLTETYTGIESSDSFVFVMSPESISSELNRQELAYAVEHNKRLIPIYYRDVNYEDVPPELASHQYIFLRESEDFETSFQMLIQALDTDLEWVAAHTRLLVRAKEWESQGRDRSLLMRGKDLEAAEAWLEQASYKAPPPTLLQTKYILASRQAATKSKRLMVGLLTAIVLLAVLLSILVATNRQPSTALGLIATALAGAGIGAVGGYAIGYARVREAPKVHGTSPEQPDPLLPETLFVSYSHEDWENFVKPRVVELRNAGFKIWLDQSHLGGGAVWMEEIEKALNICQRMVLFVSPDSLESDWVKNEYLSFIEQRKSIFPVKCRDAKIPFGLRHLNVLDYEDYDSLLKTLRSPPVRAA
jgi:hypothetical protein